MQKFEKEINNAVKEIVCLNEDKVNRRKSDVVLNGRMRPYNLQKVLVANRGETAKRFFLALHEEGIPSVAVVTEVDKEQSWYDFADEVIFIGGHDSYSNPFMIVAAALHAHANAIYSGYGFLSENAKFVEVIETVSQQKGLEIIHMGPDSITMQLLGDKITARNLARKHGISLFMSTDVFEVNDHELIKNEIERMGYPVIVNYVRVAAVKGCIVFILKMICSMQLIHA